jgi:hypothetical protein
MDDRQSGHEDGHEVEERTETREVVTRVCARKDCQFFGQEAQQGVCHTTDGDLVEWATLDAHERELLDSLRAMREREGEDYVGALEAHYVSAMMNWQLTLDECIRLRRDLAQARAAGRGTP